MIHLDDGGNALGCAQPEDGNIDGIRHGIAIERNNPEGVTGKREAANLGGAAVQHMKQDALALLHAHGLSVAEHAAVDGEGVVADLVALRHAFGERGFHRRLALFFERLHAGGRRKGVHGHVSAAAEGGLEFFQDEEDFAIVTARLVLGLDVDRSDLSAVLAGGEIGSGAIVRVVEAKARGCGMKEMRRLPCAGMNGVPSSAAPSTSTGTNCPCQCSCSGVSVSLKMSTVTRWPSLKRSSGPGNWPL